MCCRVGEATVKVSSDCSSAVTIACGCYQPIAKTLDYCNGFNCGLYICEWPGYGDVTINKSDAKLCLRVILSILYLSDQK